MKAVKKRLFRMSYNITKWRNIKSEFDGLWQLILTLALTIVTVITTKNCHKWNRINNATRSG